MNEGISTLGWIRAGDLTSGLQLLTLAGRAATVAVLKHTAVFLLRSGRIWACRGVDRSGVFALGRNEACRTGFIWVVIHRELKLRNRRTQRNMNIRNVKNAQSQWKSLSRPIDVQIGHGYIIISVLR